MSASLTVNGCRITAEDDGGICTMALRTSDWKIQHPYIALLEAKRAFQLVEVDDRERITPYVSNETLAQYLAEAVITRGANRALMRQDVFLIAATNTFLRFVHFEFGSDYDEYIEATGEAQMKLVEDEDKDTFVHMSCTKWFNLQEVQGRRNALCHVLALLRWHAGNQ